MLSLPRIPCAIRGVITKIPIEDFLKLKHGRRDTSTEYRLNSERVKKKGTF